MPHSRRRPAGTLNPLFAGVLLGLSGCSADIESSAVAEAVPPTGMSSESIAVIKTAAAEVRAALVQHVRAQTETGRLTVMLPPDHPRWAEHQVVGAMYQLVTDIAHTAAAKELHRPDAAQVDVMALAREELVTPIHLLFVGAPAGTLGDVDTIARMPRNALVAHDLGALNRAVPDGSYLLFPLLYPKNLPELLDGPVNTQVVRAVGEAFPSALLRSNGLHQGVLLSPVPVRRTAP